MCVGWSVVRVAKVLSFEIGKQPFVGFNVISFLSVLGRFGTMH